MKFIKIAEGIFNESGEISVSSDSNTGRSKFSPVKATEVYTKLKRNSWLKLDGKYYVNLGDNGLFLYRDYLSIPCSSDIELLPTTDPDSKLGKFRLYELSSNSIDSNILQNLSTTVDGAYKNVFKNLEIPDTYKPHPSQKTSYIGGYYGRNYYSDAKIYYNYHDDEFRSKQYFDLLSSTDTYTNRIDLNRILDYIKIPELSFEFSISLKYTTTENEEREVFTNAKLFWYNTETGELEKKNDYREEFNSEVVIFLDPSRNTLECCPLRSNVRECVFSSCIVGYGKKQ